MPLRNLAAKLLVARARLVGFFWGVAESTFFFVLPDFFLVPAVLARPRKIWALVLAIVAGSAVGALILSLFVAVAPDTIRSLLLAVPFTYEPMFATTDESVHSLASVFFQPFSGVPVKVWLWSAVTENVSFVPFFVTLMLGRLFRMSVIACIALGVSRVFGKAIRRHVYVFSLLYICIFFVSLALVAKNA